MRYVENITQNKFEIKKSKFISYLIPYDQFKIELNTIKQTHIKARHIIWAYRYYNDTHQIIENSFDDKEPKNSAGKPTLKVLKGADIVNAALVTVRYFGGTKLGIGGIIRAYSNSANLLISMSNTKEYLNLQQLKIDIDFTHLSLVEYKCKINSIKIIDKKFSTRITLILEGIQDNISVINKYIKSL